MKNFTSTMISIFKNLFNTIFNTANVEFLTKPFYGGKKNRITAEILQPDRKSFVTISGEWNGAMVAKWTDGVLYTLHSPRAMPYDSPIC